MKRDHEIAVISKGAFARTVRIFAPKAATKAVIIHDGGTFFGEPKTNIVSDIKKLGIKNTAVIGIDCGNRLDDYLPFEIEQSDLKFPTGGGKADEYCEYITTTLIPYLDKRFKFDRYAMLGVSTAAAATLYAASRYDDIFSAYGIISPPLFLSPSAFDGFLRASKFATARYFIHTATDVAESFLQNVPQPMFSACGATIAATLIGKGATSVILDTNKTDADGNAATPVSDFIKMFSDLR